MLERARFESINSFETLVAFLRSWSREAGPYDFVGMMHLLAACIDNLREGALDAELEDAAECLSSEQLIFLRRLIALGTSGDGAPGTDSRA